MLIDRVFKKIQVSLAPTELDKQLRRWYDNDSVLELSTDFDLDETSIVLDVGGFEGQWSSDLYSRYRCKIHIFEPIPSFAAAIRHRFQRNDDISVHEMGLGAQESQASMSLAGQGVHCFEVTPGK